MRPNKRTRFEAAAMHLGRLATECIPVRSGPVIHVEMQSLPPPSSQGSIPFSGSKDYGLSPEDRTQAMLVWILSIFAPVMAPIIFLVISRRGGFSYRHAAQSITISVLYPVAMFLCACTGVGVILSFLLGILWLVLQILGALAANDGRDFKPPITDGIARSVFGF